MQFCAKTTQETAQNIIQTHQIRTGARECLREHASHPQAFTATHAKPPARTPSAQV